MQDGCEMFFKAMPQAFQPEAKKQISLTQPNWTVPAGNNP
jgi:hypothetical protein